MEDPEKQGLIGLFVRLLIQGEEDAFKFLKELDKDAFFNTNILEEHVFNEDWKNANDYLLKFFGPGDRVFVCLASCSENEGMDNVDANLSRLFWEVEAEKDRKFGELQISKDVRSSIPGIPLLSLLEAVKQFIDVDETALMAMVEDMKVKAARKRERAQDLLLKSDTAMYKAFMAVKLAEAAEDLGSAQVVADTLLADNDDN